MKSLNESIRRKLYVNVRDEMDDAARKETNRKVMRHGDVLLVPGTRPEGGVRKSDNVVAEGEVTGHAHRITGGEVWDHDGELWVSSGDKCTITHEEHNTLPVDGDRQVIIQREYDDQEEWRNVVD